MMRKAILGVLAAGIFLAGMSENVLAEHSGGWGKPSQQELTWPLAKLCMGCQAFAYEGQVGKPREEARKTAHSGFRQSRSSARLFIGIAIPLGIVVSRRVARRNFSCRAWAEWRRGGSEIFPLVALSFGGSTKREGPRRFISFLDE